MPNLLLLLLVRLVLLSPWAVRPSPAGHDPGRKSYIVVLISILMKYKIIGRIALDRKVMRFDGAVFADHDEEAVEHASLAVNKFVKTLRADDYSPGRLPPASATTTTYHLFARDGRFVMTCWLSGGLITHQWK